MKMSILSIMALLTITIMFGLKHSMKAQFNELIHCYLFLSTKCASLHFVKNILPNSSEVLLKINHLVASAASKASGRTIILGRAILRSRSSAQRHRPCTHFQLGHRGGCYCGLDQAVDLQHLEQHLAAQETVSSLVGCASG